MTGDITPDGEYWKKYMQYIHEMVALDLLVKDPDDPHRGAISKKFLEYFWESSYGQRLNALKEEHLNIYVDQESRLWGALLNLIMHYIDERHPDLDVTSIPKSRMEEYVFIMGAILDERCEKMMTLEKLEEYSQ